MNILFLTTHLNTGGITSYLLTLSTELISAGHAVHVISAGGDQEESFRSAGVRVFHLNIRTKSVLSPKIFLNLMAIRSYAIAHRIDIVHVHTRITQMAAFWVQKISGVPFISTCHGFFRPRLFRRLFPAWGEAVIAISPAVEKHLIQDFGVPSARVHLVESGIDVGRFYPVESSLKDQRRTETGYADEILIGIIARFSGVKGQDLLIRAMPAVIKACPSVRLLLIGQGKEEKVLRDWVERLDLQAHIRFHPVVARTAEMLSILDIYANPSRNEGLGLSIMEAQAMALPVVGTNVGGIPGLIRDGETGLLTEPESAVGTDDAVASLASALILLASDAELRRRLGQNARHFAVENHSSLRMAEKTMECYETVIRKNKNGT